MVVERSCSLKIRSPRTSGRRRPYRLGKRAERQAETRRRVGEAALGVLSSGWTARRRARGRLRGAIGHALSFYTWRSLEREQEMSRRDAVDSMLALAEDAAGHQR